MAGHHRYGSPTLRVHTGVLGLMPYGPSHRYRPGLSSRAELPADPGSSPQEPVKVTSILIA
jgi:hypothetical protein